MHKVYILEENFYYEGREVIGVYSSEMAANLEIDYITESFCDEFIITEWNLETQENKELIRKSNVK